MRYGLISDIHGNLEALEAVLDRLAKERIGGYLCIGDIIGYGANPKEVLEFIRFLNKIENETSPELDLHLIVDNYGTHKHPRVESWLKRHPRFHLHFIPTSGSWLNMVERWFR